MRVETHETWLEDNRYLNSPAGRAEEGDETGRPASAAVVGAPGYALRTDHGNPESTGYRPTLHNLTHYTAVPPDPAAWNCG